MKTQQEVLLAIETKEISFEMKCEVYVFYMRQKSETSLPDPYYLQIVAAFKKACENKLREFSSTWEQHAYLKAYFMLDQTASRIPFNPVAVVVSVLCEVLIEIADWSSISETDRIAMIDSWNGWLRFNGVKVRNALFESIDWTARSSGSTLPQTLAKDFGYAYYMRITKDFIVYLVKRKLLTEPDLKELITLYVWSALEYVLSDSRRTLAEKFEFIKLRGFRFSFPGRTCMRRHSDQNVLDRHLEQDVFPNTFMDDKQIFDFAKAISNLYDAPHHEVWRISFSHLKTLKYKLLWTKRMGDWEMCVEVLKSVHSLDDLTAGQRWLLAKGVTYIPEKKDVTSFAQELDLFYGVLKYYLERDYTPNTKQEFQLLHILDHFASDFAFKTAVLKANVTPESRKAQKKVLSITSLILSSIRSEFWEQDIRQPRMEKDDDMNIDHFLCTITRRYVAWTALGKMIRAYLLCFFPNNELLNNPEK